MRKKIVIIGGGGVAREVHDVLISINSHQLQQEEESKFDFLGFVTPPTQFLDALNCRGPVLGGDEVLNELPAGTSFVIGIGSGEIRSKIADLAIAAGLLPATLIHPRAEIGSFGNTISEGTVICALASVTCDVSIGAHVYIDRNVTIGHDSRIENFASIYPSASISGNVTIGHEATIGTGSRVIQGMNIGSGSFIGAGAVVINDVPDNATVVGVPAKQIRGT